MYSLKLHAAFAAHNHHIISLYITMYRLGWQFYFFTLRLNITQHLPSLFILSQKNATNTQIFSDSLRNSSVLLEKQDFSESSDLFLLPLDVFLGFWVLQIIREKLISPTHYSKRLSFPHDNSSTQQYRTLLIMAEILPTSCPWARLFLTFL